MRKSKDPIPVGKGQKGPQVVPNRQMLRRAKNGVTQRSGSPYARIPSGRKLASCSLEAYVVLRQPRVNAEGDVIGYTSIEIPREQFERRS